LESKPAQKQVARVEALPNLKAAAFATRKRISSVLSNTDIAELLAQQAERETGILTRAFRRAAREEPRRRLRLRCHLARVAWRA